MTDLMESAVAILRLSSTRLTQVSENVGNVSTPGYKRGVTYRAMQTALTADGATSTWHDRAQGKLQATGAPLDLAIQGDGAFELRDGEQVVAARSGQFHRMNDGRLADDRGRIVQDSGGGDVVLAREDVTVLPDGTILDGQRPVARIALISESGGEAEGATLRQGMVEASNVALGDEMLAMMTAMREAEGGARLVHMYDELMGRAFTTLGVGR